MLISVRSTQSAPHTRRKTLTIVRAVIFRASNVSRSAARLFSPLLVRVRPWSLPELPQGFLNNSGRTLKMRANELIRFIRSRYVR